MKHRIIIIALLLILAAGGTLAQKKVPSGIRVIKTMPYNWFGSAPAIITLSDTSNKVVKNITTEITAGKMVTIDIHTLVAGNYTLHITANAPGNIDTIIHKNATDKQILLTLTRAGDPYHGLPVKKPVIYLYPEHAEAISVKVAFKGELTKTIPSYDSGWQVWATPGGLITNNADGKQYPYLFWEGNSNKQNWNMKEGFVVRGDESRKFLAATLPQMGLNAGEYNEFIDFWAPVMEKNEYNLIHFAGREYEEIARLSIAPKPDAVLRVFMAFQPAQKDTRVLPQHFKGFQRKGFTVVEWGGMELTEREEKTIAP